MNEQELNEIRAQLKWMAPLIRELEPVARREQQEGLVRSLEAAGKVVKDKKSALESGTVWSGLGGAVAAFYAALELFPAAVASGGEWDTFGAAAGAFLTALTAIYRRWKVGDLRILP